MSLNISPTTPPTTELAALEHLKIYVQSCDHSSAFIFDWTFYILIGNEVNHKSLDKLGFRQFPLGTVKLAALGRLEFSP